MSRGALEDYAPHRVTILRERARLTHRDIAAHCDVTIGTARNWENGAITPAETKGLVLARTLGVHPADLTNTPRNQPTLKQLRQWLGLTARAAAEQAGIGPTSIWDAETYTKTPPQHIQAALAGIYNVTEKQIFSAWKRGRALAYGNIDKK